MRRWEKNGGKYVCFDPEKCLGIPTRDLAAGEDVIIIVSSTGEITSPDLIIDPELRPEDLGLRFNGLFWCK